MTPAHLHALQSIYAAALDPDRWQMALDAMAAAVGGVRTHLLHAGTQGGMADRSLVSGYAPEYLQSWDAYYAGMNAWAPGMLNLPVGQPHLCELMCGYDSLKRTEFYADWVQPQDDIIGGGAVVLNRGVGKVTILGGNIPRRYRDRLDDLWQSSLSIFGPAVRHAFAVNAMMLGLRLEQMLGRVSAARDTTAILLLDGNRRLIFSDTGGAEALEAGTMVKLLPQLRVGFVEDALDRVLANVLQRARDVAQQPQVRQMTETEVTFFPIDPHTGQTLRLPPLPLSTTPAIAIFLRNLTSAPESVLTQQLGLTPAEADLACLLAEGQTVAEVAAVRGTSVHTVRNQLRAVLSKTGCRRQTELVILVQHVLRAGP